MARTFSDLEFRPHHNAPDDGGVRAVAEFANGFKASVVRFRGSYGYEDGLYELAVMDANGLRYDTPITNDVVGYLSEDEVTKLLADIEALPLAEQASA